MHTHQARSGDLFLLCSDGLTSMVRQDRVQEIVAGSDSLRAAADRLVAEANEMGGRDNITVVLFRLGGDEADGARARGGGDDGRRARRVEADTDTHEVAAAPRRRRHRRRAAEPTSARRRRVTFKRVVATLLVAGRAGGARRRRASWGCGRSTSSARTTAGS